MKAVTHHTTPLNQFLYVSCVEALHGDYSSLNADNLTVEDCQPVYIFKIRKNQILTIQGF